ncbi:MAG TPA: nucleotidyltransferase domain-containing protein [Jatrophihabitans sp.]|nr:nucleotidyltransferase domain-containing protein [Jatrophihabitans sp.]
MFSDAERSQVAADLLAAARADAGIVAAARVGSAALDRSDQWSDLDIALRLATGLAPDDVLGSWTDRVYAQHGAVTHFDLWSGPTLFRVFLLASSLEIDLSFWPYEVFAPTSESFRLVFGQANEPAPRALRAPEPVIGMAWLYALHVRSSIGRGRGLQALSMLNCMREQIICLACLRNGLPAEHCRGVDDLPEQLTQRLSETVVRGLDRSELNRSLGCLTDLLLAEAAAVDEQLADRLRPVLAELVRTAQVGGS